MAHLYYGIHSMKLIIVDGHNYLYRAFFAIRHLSNSAGEPTNAIHGFIKMLLKLVREENPSHLAMTFDSGKSSVRASIYSEYKSTRPPMPEELVFQIPFIKEITTALGFQVFERDRVEADDLIASLVELTRDRVEEILIASADKDLLQLVDDKVKVLNDRAPRIVFDRKAVKKKMGVRADQMADFLALMGDSSDNIPGVRGVGDKTARTLLLKFESLDNLYNNIEAVNSKSLQRKLVADKEKAYLSRQLVAIDKNVPLQAGLDDLEIREPDKEKLLPLLKRFELYSLLKDYQVPLQEDSRLPVRVIDNERDWLNEIKAISRRKRIAVDWIMDGESPLTAKLRGVGLFDGVTVVFGGEDIPKKSLIKGLTELKTSANMIIGSGLKTLYILAALNGIELTEKIFDIKIASYLLNPLKKRYQLNDIWADISSSQELFKIDEINPAFLGDSLFEQALTALSRRLEIIYRSFSLLDERLKTAGLNDLYLEMEQPLTRILAGMERTGIKVLPEKLSELSEQVNVGLKELTKKIYDLAGEEFNPNSSQQLGDILFNKLELPVIRKTKTGPSTDIDTLEVLAAEHPLPAAIIEYRQLAKLRSAYIETLPWMINKDDGRVHTCFHQVGTLTGRLSSSEPNLQNSPARSEPGKKIRAAFVSEPGCYLLSADYSQMELRVLAHFSEDENLIEAFEEDKDIHTHTAAELFQCFPQLVTKEMRQRAKAVNFGVVYGLGAFALARQLKIPYREAKSIINRYFERYQNVAEYIKGVVTEAKITGYVRTLSGRRRVLPEIMSGNKNRREFSERAAVNTIIQGSSADIIQIAILKIDQVLRNKNLASRLLLQIHDELMYEVPEAEVELMKDVVRWEMERAASLKVPLKVSVGLGRNWAELN